MSRSLLFFLLLNSTFSFAFDWQGHRGARGLYPENTIGSMSEALKYGVTTLELDVVISRDRQVVVSHEPWMNEEICLDLEGRSFKGKKFNLYKLDYSDIMKFDCGSRPHARFPEQLKIRVGKPLLQTLLTSTEEQLKNLGREDVQYNIEIKSTPQDETKGYQPDVETFSDLVIATIALKLPTKRYTIQSFDWRVLKYLHKKYPEVRLVALTEKVDPADDLSRLGFNPYAYSPYFKKIKKEHIHYFQSKGIKVIPWTVNEVSDMKFLMSMGVDGIITDYPNRIELVLQKKCRKGFNYFENKCVEVPTHAVPSETNPGWSCKPGYLQKRSRCEKLVLPAHSRLTPDGKSWECLEGYTRYRGNCKK